MKSHKLAILALGLLAALSLPAQHDAHDGHISVLPQELKWQAAPSVGPGVEIAVIEGDLKAAAPFTFRLKLPPNFRVGVHTHPVTERVTVISGMFYLGIGDRFDEANAKAYPAGGIAMMPPEMKMFAFTRDEGTVLQIHGTGPWGIKYADPADDPAAKK